jgi:RecA/RadA recombinase
MAKKTINKKFEFSKVGEILDKISEKVSILVDREEKPRTFIGTGNYVFNAALSGSMFGGIIGNGGIITFAGPEASGKTFLALNVIREAQKDGYCIVYIDTEYAINRTELPKYGIDNSPEKFLIVRSGQVEEINMATTQLIDELKQAKLDGYELPKQLWVLDSLGQLSSRKMKEDLIAGNLKTDMSKAKAIGSMFVSITADLNFLEIPLIVNNQTYETMDLFSQTIMKGGKQLYYSSNIIVFLTKAKLKDDTDDMDIGQSGIIVTAKCVKNRLAKPKQVKFEISFEKGMNPYKGLENFLKPEFFNQIGIAQGKMEVDKSTGEMIFRPGGNRWYVNHLNKSITKNQLHTPEVFTLDVLKKMEPIINNYFKYKSVNEIEEMENKFNDIMDEEEDTNGFSDSIDGEDFFG